MASAAIWALAAALLMVTSVGAREAPPRPLLQAAGARLQEVGARLPPLPPPPDLDAIKKVAQILLVLGEQVIPSIVGELAPPPAACAAPPDDAPGDPVNLD